MNILSGRRQGLIRLFAVSLGLLLAYGFAPGINPAPAAAANLTDVAAAHERILADETLQFDPPLATLEVEPPSWLTAIFRFIGKVLGAVFQFLAPFLKILFWVALAALVGGVVVFLILELMKRRSGGRMKPVEARTAHLTPYAPSREAARALLEEADRLAREGRFGEAVHVLLFRSIDDIEKHRPHQIHRAMTSREIAGLSILGAASALALARIVSAVERCRFAGGEIDEAGFNQCRAAYMDFAAPGAWT